ncbi:acyl-CoA thioester hydrolase/BAAT C-terminal domain-containing protein [Providencia vermicola]|uniref:Alpha/beta hydrolase n=2 Tax=Providencia TaxID=586 RepID=A0AAI9MV57_PROST|nr:MULTISPECIES: acyl-CoA thioester hydrolase/BAAT C-terminal domain-containing protein [Providencia]ELR5035438.1 alpha/beta hydrolase [Providencia stuartii]ELR5141726.1 alpha/beta hydrolase [Providencia stuartii]ELX8378226.1 alpha/beta hydrolase [Providencia stuartii]ELZ5939207.1 alpha/beta hydrolase [Providencia stuartii]EMD5259042.1 alpha/beta hydrolase [Providencia stuartii]
MKILPVILCSMSFFIANQANSSPELQKIQNKQGKEIHYYLLKQNEQPAENLLVLIQGSDCRSVINNTNMVENFAIAFPDNDILLVEKTGLDSQVGKDGKEVSAEDCPIAYMENDSPLERKDNYLTLLAHFKNSYQHIVLLGGSEGAVVTNLIVADTDMVHASISLNGGGAFFINDVLYSIEKTVPSEESSHAIEGFKQFAKDVVQNKLQQDNYPSEHGKKWWREMLMINNQKLLQSVKTPHLVIQTMNDTHVDPHSVMRMMGYVNNNHVSFKTYPDLDHFFIDDKGKSQTNVIVNDIQKWYRAIDK